MPLSGFTTSARVLPQQLLNNYELRLMARDLSAHQGVSIDTLLKDAGLPAQLLDNPARRLTLEQELELYTRIARINTDPMLGFRTGARLSLSNYGILGYAVMGAATVDEALLLLTEFAPLISWASRNHLSTEVYKGIECRCLTFYPAASESTAAALEIESTLASLQAIFSDLVDQSIVLAGIEMTHKCEAQGLPELNQMFDCPLLAGSARNAILVPLDQASVLLPHPQPEYSELFREMCQQSMSALMHDRGLVDSVCGLIREAESSTLSLEQAAKHFGLSSRTLRRYLQSMGVSYQGLLDEVRYAQARHFLSSTDLTVDAIARRLGYADARSLRIAFKRWSDVTPIEFRRRNQDV